MFRLPIRSYRSFHGYPLVIIISFFFCLSYPWSYRKKKNSLSILRWNVFTNISVLIAYSCNGVVELRFYSIQSCRSDSFVITPLHNAELLETLGVERSTSSLVHSSRCVRFSSVPSPLSHIDSRSPPSFPDARRTHQLTDDHQHTGFLDLRRTSTHVHRPMLEPPARTCFLLPPLHPFVTQHTVSTDFFVISPPPALFLTQIVEHKMGARMLTISEPCPR